MTTTLLATPVSEYAIIVDPRDDVAVVKTETTPGLELSLPDGREICVSGVVLPGHHFATRAIPTGEFVLQYGSFRLIKLKCQRANLQTLPASLR